METVRTVDRLRYQRDGWWTDTPLHEMVRAHARSRPDASAIMTPDRTVTWREYDRRADDIALTLLGLGLAAGDRVAVQLPDGPEIHAALIATARAGLVAVGIGHRAGRRETDHLVTRTGARVLITADGVGDGGVDPSLDYRILLDESGVARVEQTASGELRRIDPPRAPESALAGAGVGPDDLSIINSTSGTTGLPKCVTQFDNRWLAFSRLAEGAGQLDASDVVLAAVPTPFGFGLWTSHYAPVMLGVPVVVLPRYSTDQMVELIERHRVTVLCCVSTQFKMLLNSASAETADLSSLRVMFTGGEAVPYRSAAEFETRTGAAVLQFYGSNETGALSCTTLDDPQERRLRTAGRLIESMNVRLTDTDGHPTPILGGMGRPSARGPLLCGGYYDDPAANSELYTDDGWMLMGDIVEVDTDGYLSVVGRTSDFIIRGGKNLSAPQVEAMVAEHPAVDLCAVVPAPDEVFGERVCAVVTLRRGRSLDLPELTGFLDGLGVSKDLRPELLFVRDDLPRSSGAKLAKGEIKEWVRAQVLTTRAR
ncbi:class I adenylate-forming enzyme family protein [Gordonia neofelifaecis]|uniref:Acyl-CoA ligase/synthetase n=1 Tax=Gordonia neofelifaecis NRRL B-59395 TaxID=644548 RepID=F1YE40_9ACTN|nr:class I adenylate-forming enzyme family protein [Gordonia neofelifaecis]EGD57130.1 acyl-CoA ligase/synthetase [Gordonia neofelifaecis NRRL B-59395]